MSNKATQAALARRILARRRLLQFVRETYPTYLPGWVHDDICRRLERFSEQVEKGLSPRLMLLVPPRHGKLLADDTLVMTSEGWKTHGDLQVGDEVLGLDLKWTKVIGTSRPGIADIEITTNAGTKLLCHEAHEWAVDEFCQKGGVGKRRGYARRVVEATELLEYKDRVGDMRTAAGASPVKPGNVRGRGMRRFYLPDLTFKSIPIPLKEVMQLRRRPLNGGALAIEDVRRVSPEEAQPGKCIQVAAHDGVYLVTRDLVPTHNSELASIRFPAWHLGKFPTHEVINVGYNLDLPMKFSRKVRDLMRDPSYTAIFPDARLSPESQSIEAWNTVAGGGFTAAGVGGGITGKGCFHTDTMVDTCERGEVPLSEVAVGDLIRGYDHEQRQEVWTRVLAVHATASAARADEFVSPLRCTPDHELFVPERGEYVCAADVASQGLSVLRRGEGTARDSVHGLPAPAGTSGGFSPADVRALRNRFSAASRRTAQTRAARRHRTYFLLEGVLERVAQKMRGATARGMLALFKTVDQALPGKVLLAGVLPRFAPAGGELRRELLGAEVSGAGPGQQHVRAIGEDSAVGSAPHRPRPDEQHLAQFDHALEAGARVLSRTCGRTAGGVARVVSQNCPGEDVVIDVQTGTANLFADGVLAHNCHILIIDDPIKNQEEADSALVRDKLMSWYQSTAYTRLAPGGGVLVIETFWNDDDLAGRLQQHMLKDPDSDQFEVVRYPAEATQYEYRHPVTLEVTRSDIPNPPSAEHELLRSPGEALHPDRYPAEALRRIKANLEPRIWSALYQQNPVPDEGLYFTKEMFRYAPELPPLVDGRIFTAWDFAIGEKQVNDWNVGATIFQDSYDRIYVLDVVRFKGNAFDIVANIVAVVQTWGSIPGTDYRLGFEDGQLFKALRPSIVEAFDKARIAPSWVALPPLTDKLGRARPLQGRMQQGRVYFPQAAPWLPTVQQEMLRFPAGAHDDIIDGLAWAVRLLLEQPAVRPQEAPKIKTWRDKLALLTAGSGGGHMSA